MQKVNARKQNAAFAETAIGDILNFNISQNSPVAVNLGQGYDVVNVSGNSRVNQVRLTFTSSEIGNSSANDSGTGVNQDGGLAVRMQAEINGDRLDGPVSRFDDEGISFVATGDFTFDVRDLTSGVSRGAQFKVVRLGTALGETWDDSASTVNTYINGGMGKDRLYGGAANDFLVGGADGDRLEGNAGNDSFIGGGGNDQIFGGAGADTAIMNVATDGEDRIDLGFGADTIAMTGGGATTQVRLTFTSSEVGNGVATDSGTLANQDGNLAVRVQAERADGSLPIGVLTRTDDEGVTFTSDGTFTYDVRDLPTGTERGNGFEVVQLGAIGNDSIVFTDRGLDYYVNGGMGNDVIRAGLGNDTLVGGMGDDTLAGALGNDTLIGGVGVDTFVFAPTDLGTDTVSDFVSGTDKIDMSLFGITIDDVTITTAGTTTTLFVDSDVDSLGDLTIVLSNVTMVAESDFIF